MTERFLRRILLQRQASVAYFTKGSAGPKNTELISNKVYWNS